MAKLMFRLQIECDNDAFEGEPAFEIARILHDLSKRIERGDVTSLYQNVRDVNGNPCGTYRLKDEAGQ